MSLIGALQLACRHPKFDGISRYAAEVLLMQLTAYFKDYPALMELIKLGDDPNSDVLFDGK